MGTGMEHAALAVFTTLAPMAAGSFLVLAYAFFAGKLDAEATKRLDKITTVAAVVMLVGFIGAFMHLANPLAAFGVFAGVGSSPLSNELVVAVVLGVLALVYWIWALTGTMPMGVRKALLAVLAVGSLVFAVFCGMAYMMDTIPTWNNPLSIVQMLGYTIAGGTALGFLIIGMAKVELPENAKGVALGLAAAGVVIGLAGLAGQAAGLGSIVNIWGSAAELVPGLWGFIVVFVACGAAACALLAMSAKKQFSPALTGAAAALMVVGIFVARIAFYGLFMGIAL